MKKKRNNMPTLKQQIQIEILDVLNDRIDNEIVAMGGHYTVAEIAREVLISDQ